MDRKKLWVFTGILVAVAAVTVFLDKGSAPLADARTGKAVVDGVSLPAVDRLELKKGPQTLVLVRSADQSWRLSDDKGFPADAAKIGALFDELSRAKVESIVAAKKEALAGFGLDAPAVLKLDAGGKNLLTLDVGDARKNGGQYIAFGDEAKAYLISQTIAALPDEDNWQHKALLEIPKDQVKSIAFTPSAPTGKAVTLSRAKKEDPLKVEGLGAKDKEKPGVSSAENYAVAVTFSKLRDKSYANAQAALAHPAKAVVTTFEGKTYELLSGSVGGDKTPVYFMVVSGSPTLDELNKTHSFEVSPSVAQRFDKAWTDFVEAEKS